MISMRSLLAIPMPLILIKFSLLGVLFFPFALTAENKLLQPVDIEITSYLGDQQLFQKNDILAFLLSLNKDAYIFAIYEDASQQLMQIIPNKNQQNNFYSAGIFIAVPAQGADFQLVVQPPFGKEKLWVFATDVEKIILTGKLQMNGLKLLEGDIKKVRQQIKQQSKKIWGEAHFSLTTQG